MTKKILAVVLCTFFTSLAWGQYVASGVHHFETVDIGQGYWHTMPGSATKVASGYAGVWAMDQYGNTYQYNEYPTNSWTARGGLASDIAVGDAPYALGPTYTNGGIASNLYKWNGSVWAQDPIPSGPSAFSKLAVGGDGDRWALTSDCGVWHVENGAWREFPGDCAAQIAAAGEGVTWVTDSSSRIFYWNGSGTTTFTQVMGYEGVNVAVGPDIQPFITDGTGAVFQWNHSNSTFVKLSDQSVDCHRSLATAGFNGLTTWCVDNGGGVHRLSDLRLHYTGTMSGTYSGTPMSGASHTAVAHAYYQTCAPDATCSSHVENHGSSGCAGNCFITASQDAFKGDVLTCFDSNSDPGLCTGVTEGFVDCTVGGENFRSSVTTKGRPSFAIMVGRYTWNGGTYIAAENCKCADRKYAWRVEPWCSNGTPSPLIYDPITQNYAVIWDYSFLQMGTAPYTSTWNTNADYEVTNGVAEQVGEAQHWPSMITSKSNSCDLSPHVIF